MFKRVIILLLVVVVTSIQIKAAETKTIAIIPRPMKMEVQAGTFNITPKTTIIVTSGARRIGQYLSELLAPATGFKLKVRKLSQMKRRANCIVLRTVTDKNHLGPEGYELKVLKDRVLIDAPKPAGLFYACQSLRQLLPPAIESKEKVYGVAWTVPRVHIEDKPRFQWRGLMLDSSRYFQPKEFIKRYIDLLAYHKMNRFHWHLTDEQGWRVEIKKYPNLTEFGAWQKARGIEKVGGFYTQKDIREIVAFAQSRYVTIIPEIEMPGHAQAALASYPQFSCTGGPFEVKTGGGRHPEPYRYHGKVNFCPGNDKTFEFLQDVLSEVVELFPAPWLHIGGDECVKDFWKKCPKCQARIKAQGLKDEDELQSYFIKRVENFLLTRNRRLVGWDEILEGGLAPNATVQSWRGVAGGIAAAEQGHDVIMSPTSHCYLDSSNKQTTVVKVYSFEPIPLQLPADKTSHILGLEAAMWTHLSPTLFHIDRQVFPRLCALAEVGWSPKDLRQWEDFGERLKLHCSRLFLLGVNYFREWQWTDPAHPYYRDYYR